MRVPSLSKIIACGLKFFSKCIYYLSTFDKKSHGLARGSVYTIISLNLTRLICVAPPVERRCETNDSGYDHKDVAVHADQLVAWPGCATEQRRHGPREPIAPARRSNDLGKEDRQYRPAEGRQIPASHAGDECHGGHQEQSHAGRGEEIEERSPCESYRPAGDTD